MSYSNLNFKDYPEVLMEIEKTGKNLDVEKLFEHRDRGLEISTAESERRKAERRVRIHVQSCLDMEEGIDSILMSIDGHMLFTCRSINLIFGFTATGKTTLAHCIVASILREDGLFEALKLKKELPKDIRVLWIDSELYPNEFAKAKNKILRLSEVKREEKKLLPYRMQEVGTNQRIGRLEEFISTAAKDFASSHLVIIIDTITDFVNNFNDPEESDGIVKKLLEVVNKNDCTIICLMHETKASDRAMGHLGSALERKAGSILRLNRTENKHHIQNLKNRNASEFDDIYIEFSDDGTYLRNVDHQNTLEGIGRVGRSPSFTDEELHTRYMELAENGKMPYSVFRCQLSIRLGCSERTLTDYIKGPNRGSYSYRYSKKDKMVEVIAKEPTNELRQVSVGFEL